MGSGNRERQTDVRVKFTELGENILTLRSGKPLKLSEAITGYGVDRVWTDGNWERQLIEASYDGKPLDS